MTTGWLNRIHVGDCCRLMRAMIADGVKVQCIVTSPPYWGRRDYGMAGAYGLERTWIRHLARMRYVFRLARELLADDGLLWLNYGDAYYSPRVNGGIGKTSTVGQRTQRAFQDAQRAQSSRKQQTNGGSIHVSSMNRRYGQPRLKPKDMIGMPWTLALLLRADGWYLRSDVIWSKPNPMPESVEDRPTKSHEYLFMLSRSEQYFSNMSAIYEPSSVESHARAARGRSEKHKYADGGPNNQTIAKGSPVAGRPAGVNPKSVGGWAKGDRPHTAIAHNQPTNKQDGSGDPRQKGFNARYRSKQNASFSAAVCDTVMMRNPRTVWTIPTEPFSGAHFATFPTELVKRCILSGTRPGDVVFDPFMGSGTVAQVADALGRRWIGAEINPKYAAMYGSLREAQLGMVL